MGSHGSSGRQGRGALRQQQMGRVQAVTVIAPALVQLAGADETPNKCSIKSALKNKGMLHPTLVHLRQSGASW